MFNYYQGFGILKLSYQREHHSLQVGCVSIMIKLSVRVCICVAIFVEGEIPHKCLDVITDQKFKLHVII